MKIRPRSEREYKSEIQMIITPTQIFLQLLMNPQLLPGLDHTRGQ